MQGQWLPSFAHGNNHATYQWTNYSGSYNAVHMAVIPKGPFQGWVMVFSAPLLPLGSWNGTQEWSIFNPEADPVVFYNFTLTIPNTPAGEPQTLFCSGHAWTRNGNLFLAGGTKRFTVPNTTPSQYILLGSQLVYIWDPLQWNGANGGWFQQTGTKQLAQQRFYPTVTVLGLGYPSTEPDDKIMVSGGHPTPGTPGGPPSTYEVARLGPYIPPPSQNQTGPSVQGWDTWTNGTQIFDGPQPNAPHHDPADPLDLYPRMHLLSNGATLYSGAFKDNGTMLHNPPNRRPILDFTRGQGDPGVLVSSNTSVLFPINLDKPAGQEVYDIVMRMGGALLNPHQALNTVEFCDTRTTPAPWNNPGIPPMHKPREFLNSVLLPDESILVIGGSTGVPAPLADDAEFYKLSTNTWTLTHLMESLREYHSVAVLLPSGRVLVGGGDSRTKDYQIYEPPYLFNGERPVITGISATTLGYGQEYTVNHQTMTSPFSVQKVVLIRPGSVTHHSCMDQRCLVLKQVLAGTTFRTFKAPPTVNGAPRGYYMLFLVSNAGVPSVATWVNLQ